MDNSMQEALAMDTAMLESMGAGPQPLAFAQDEIWVVSQFENGRY